ncbi:MAG: bifunctional DNA-formamidopyrimidine glycosylase/DNA-(apurinic or apyrimidinic site) lyase [Alphaproteobacteria bacterium]|nr:bifunctional DNA-formamidopyrimidine glycosylase/DNA-(apurinic or apyrimidinic site) lyase [Alphaproteobacteria bacterium]MDE2337620.1 bifunctional DNA-formamidopyrimidine glycosylase/DNA-(apurinic or apyrimidinic site) lyase [Alphaproteobacteria bacterium]
MPELPEVETVCRGLAKKLAGHKIKSVALHRGGLRVPFPPALGKLANVKVKSVSRRAKYVLVNLADGRTLILHLGMSGRILIFGKRDIYEPSKHDHLVLTCDDGTRAVMNDPRRFGLATLAKTEGLENHRLFRALGPEPLGNGFTAAYLAEKLAGKKAAIKLVVMDQRVVVGVGNIYASEALFAARIDPRAAAGSLKPAAVKRLVAEVKAVLKRAIAAGGSSLRDYVQTDGELGYFQHRFAVYGREGQKCKGCACDIEKTGGIKRITQGGRSTFYCPVRQAGLG